jgi:hypothetical protein
VCVRCLHLRTLSLHRASNRQAASSSGLFSRDVLSAVNAERRTLELLEQLSLKTRRYDPRREKNCCLEKSKRLHACNAFTGPRRVALLSAPIA